MRASWTEVKLKFLISVLLRRGGTQGRGHAAVEAETGAMCQAQDRPEPPRLRGAGKSPRGTQPQ